MGELGLHISFSSSEMSASGGSPPLPIPGPRGTRSPALLPLGMVPCSSKEVSRSGPSPCLSPPLPAFPRGASLPRRPVRLHASRMETMRQALSSSGWSDEAVSMLLLAHKASTSRQYQSVWEKFLSYLSLQRIPPSDLSVGVVCGFLCYHAVTLNRSYRTLTGY